MIFLKCESYHVIFLLEKSQRLLRASRRPYHHSQDPGGHWLCLEYILIHSLLAHCTPATLTFSHYSFSLLNRSVPEGILFVCASCQYSSLTYKFLEGRVFVSIHDLRRVSSAEYQTTLPSRIDCICGSLCWNTLLRPHLAHCLSCLSLPWEELPWLLQQRWLLFHVLITPFSDGFTKIGNWLSDSSMICMWFFH